jgi:hypothetical protein
MNDEDIETLDEQEPVTLIVTINPETEEVLSVEELV